VTPSSALSDLQPVAQGKVRDIYAVGDDRLLLVTSDRISTYDVVHPTPIPDKGKVLTGLARRINGDAAATAVGTPVDIDAFVAELTA